MDHPGAANARIDTLTASIAVVDDDASFARYVGTFLSLQGHEVRTYTRGDEILAAIRGGQRPDTVLLDVEMPGMTGLETLRALKTASPELQVIMLSGRKQANLIVEAVQLGAADYLVKPDDPEGLGDIALDSAITHAIEQNRLINDIPNRQREHSDTTVRAFPGCSDNPAMRDVDQLIERVSGSDVTVLIRGESGVGKEVVARRIHQRSARHNRPFVKVNCAALPTELLESELFGHERGAFTGAVTTHIGKFEQAHLGTILLDEIAELAPALQAKLLHVLQDAEFTKLGSNKTVSVDVRVLAATNQDLEEMMQRKAFREDLYYRLQVIETTVPPLRERRDEIRRLTDFFLAKYSERYNRPLRVLSPAVRHLLQANNWPGNIRELENTIKRFVILHDERLLTRELSASTTLAGPDLETTMSPALEPAIARTAPAATQPAPSSSIPTERLDGRTLTDVGRAASRAAERVAIVDALCRVRWNRRKAAEILRVSYKTLLNKIKDIGIERQ